MDKIKLHFEKLYREDRNGECCGVAIPFAKGELKEASLIKISDAGTIQPSQTKVTSTWDDGSVKYAFVRFLADLPGNASKDFDVVSEKNYHVPKNVVLVSKDDEKLSVSNGKLVIDFGYGSRLFEQIAYSEDIVYTENAFEGPVITIGGTACELDVEEWTVPEEGPVFAKVLGKGKIIVPEEAGLRFSEKESLDFECMIKISAGSPYFEIGWRIINRSFKDIVPESMIFRFNESFVGTPEDANKNPRTSVGRSAYRTSLYTSEEGENVSARTTADIIMEENFEHFGEVLHGCLFADYTAENYGISATVFQPYQNFPKAVTASKNGLEVHIIPEGEEKVKIGAGMAREQKFLLHFHSGATTTDEIINRALIYQMPDTPTLDPEVFERAGVMPEIFVSKRKQDQDKEIFLIDMADAHARGYGMMNWGDAPDPNYTAQGRGGGAQVWVNNEYDYGHAQYLQFARTGIRRFLDYGNVATWHQMDVDICHFGKDELKTGGQYMHICGHNGGLNGDEHFGEVTPSHEWVEGLLDCYHFTCDERAYEAALKIGENVLKLLELPKYQTVGEVGARETGWALRAFASLYEETHDPKWLSKCDMIINQFKAWRNEYGAWLQRYTDNTLIRVPFMISVAVISLERYYSATGDGSVRAMMVEAVDDLIENGMTEQGLFYYKELPSLRKNGHNPLVLEALAVAYKYTGDRKYLEAGKRTLERIMANPPAVSNKKVKVEDAVLIGNVSPKNFAQGFLPIARYYAATANII